MTKKDDSDLTIARNGNFEIVIKKSRFICHLKKITTIEDANSFIWQIKKEHYQARHNCSAMIVKNDQQVLEKSNDDGEPNGTAGTPMLTVLRNKCLVNVCAVVTRYFGGIKLGAGGLIRAYSASVTKALDHVGLAKKIKQRIISVIIDYDQNDLVQNFLANRSDLYIDNTEFAQKVTLTLFVDEAKVIKLQEQLTNLLRGKLKFTTQETKYREVRVDFE